MRPRSCAGFSGDVYPALRKVGRRGRAGDPSDHSRRADRTTELLQDTAASNINHAEFEDTDCPPERVNRLSGARRRIRETGREEINILIEIGARP